MSKTKDGGVAFPDRRALLKGAGVLGLGAVIPAWFPSPAKAVAPVVIAASIVLIAKVLDFFKRSGDMTLELSAHNVKIDQILQNELLIMQALVEIVIRLRKFKVRLAIFPPRRLAWGNL